MEATSDYWRSVYHMLQPHLNLRLVNPAHLKGIRGRKSDPSDAAFLARAGASGMALGSFGPDREIRELRDLTRRRTEVVRSAGREAAWLRERLDRTPAGRGGSMLVVGEDSSGVTSLLRLGMAEAARADAQVCRGVAAELGRRMPLLPFLECRTGTGRPLYGANPHLAEPMRSAGLLPL
ncbi:transposase [Kitasatospora sp. NPDC101155]|uniref:IS110 family transposase n=1 Tax=Kitasatospora sp. NPDC101155 TaxID=3364097 RepID=UPI0037FAC3EC